MYLSISSYKLNLSSDFIMIFLFTLVEPNSLDKRPKASSRNCGVYPYPPSRSIINISDFSIDSLNFGIRT